MAIKPLVALAVAILAISCGHARAADSPRPNFLVVMADDLGYSDLGCYGSEIETPNLDRLAAGGLRFSQFYNNAKCSQSRVSLLTGRYVYQAGGLGMNRAVTAAEVLGGAGYFTAMTGKWHLEGQPTEFGFGRYFGHLSGACSYYAGDGTFRLNGEKWDVPGEGFYTTVANVDFAMRFLAESRQAKKPWFLYLAFNAPHSPLQPLEKDYRKYLGRYDVGWDVIREARVKRQAEFGLFGKHVEPSPRPDHIPAWASLRPEQRTVEAMRMAAYAALIDRVDQELGRLIDDLKAAGGLENTLILFVSDNGACPYDRRGITAADEPYRAETRWSDSTGWAWARNAPFRFYKQNQHEGGIATPAIMHWPAGMKAKPGSVVHDPAHLVDVLPTIAQVAKADLPAQWPGRELTPVSGVSLARVLAGERLGKRPPIYFMFQTDRALRDGDWKLVSFRSNPWELYNIANERTELHDLAAREPAVRERLVKLWHETAEKVDDAPAKNRAPVATVAKPVEHPQWSDYSGEGKRPPRRERRKAAQGAVRERPVQQD